MLLATLYRLRFPFASTLILGLLLCGGLGTLSAAGQSVPKGHWEYHISENAKSQYARGTIVYTLGFTLKEGGTGSTIVGLEYTGTPLTDGLFKGKSHVKAVLACPVTKANVVGEKLFLYSGGTFKLVSGDPPGYTIKDYGTGGGLTPEVTIDKLQQSFYGVAVFKIDGENLEFVPKSDAGGKMVVFKKTR